jgi:hypothetical protein
MDDATMEASLVALLPRIQRIARKYQRRAELDDLIQEGWITCWNALAKGVQPSDQIIEGRMQNWVRFLLRHDGASYEQIMEATN